MRLSSRTQSASIVIFGLCAALAVFAVAAFPAPASAQDAAKKEPIPHAQDKPPGPALSPEEALKKMKVPEGFSVELVAAEPDVVNPVAMTIDERGRFWVTESFEYPRRSPGKGRDRIKILEDTDADGKVDKVTIFAEGLNIPSGIAVGHGLVWVANSPDIMILQDTDGDDKADETSVIVTGFGRDDTHELPNSLTWGPDGWLYGLNGVFNPSHVKQGEKEFKFTCAMFRIHPMTREFQIFCEGTSNPWGIAFDGEGSAFISACVIDHLWHLTETGYYHRQGGPYPPFTWKLESIVKHKHQKAAYCGITYFDSDAYPEKYRNKLYMGNIHGNCINVDKLQRQGATYFATPEEDFLSANDAWFMPVAQKTGPDGCLYVLDWYDRYHCYQDANRDPEGIDRAKGRLYRVRYKDTPRAGTFNLDDEKVAGLIEKLDSPNIYVRETAQRVLISRIWREFIEEGTFEKLESIILTGDPNRNQTRHALFVRISSLPLYGEFHHKLLTHESPFMRAWAIRASGNQGKVSDEIRELIVKAADDESPDVKLQVAIAARKIEGLDAMPLLVKVLATCGDDKLIPNIVWQNLYPLLEKDSDRFMKLVKEYDLKKTPNLTKIMPRVLERIAAGKKS
jgi:putative membrane-bound dehydrogenase-like protein